MVVQQIHRGDDKTIEIPEYGDTEVGQLATNFREMLTAIQERDKRLNEYAAGLEKMVKARTQELQINNEQLAQEIKGRKQAQDERSTIK